MKTSDFTFELPPELIAKQPLERRSDSRMLQLDRQHGGLQHRQFRDLPGLLRPGDLLIFNDTWVIPARLFGQKASGGRFEALVERVLDDRRLLVQLRVSKSPGPGTELRFDSRSGEPGPAVTATVLGRREQFYELELGESASVESLLEQCGHIPLPPYIDRDDVAEDQQRYQTVYASRKGAVAAPTAGLHFDDELLDSLAEQGIEKAFVTLHVGAGTFQPVRVDDVNEHRMHSEWYELPRQTCAAIAACRRRGGRVIAVGTTSVRTLEACGRQGELRPQTGETDIFIYPGFEFRVVDGLITNFHLPESTLLMLVSAFSDKEKILGAYREAVERRYRFFSYGDAMLIL